LALNNIARVEEDFQFITYAFQGTVTSNKRSEFSEIADITFSEEKVEKKAREEKGER